MIGGHLARFLALALCWSALPKSAALAEGLSCGAFLQNRDGSWRSFNEADVIGPDGVIHLEVGERLSPSAKTKKGEIARALNDLCTER